MPPASRSPFAEFARVASAVAATSSKLRKRDLLAAYLRDLSPEELGVAATFFAGRPLPGAADRLGLGWHEVAAIGDDWPDLPLLVRAGLACAPPGAHAEALAAVHHVTTAPGGRGAARSAR